MNVYTILIVAISLGAQSEALDQDNGPVISALQPSGPETAETPVMSTDFAQTRVKRQQQGPIETVITGFRQAWGILFGRMSEFIYPTTSAPVIKYVPMPDYGPGYGNGYGPGYGNGYGPGHGNEYGPGHGNGYGSGNGPDSGLKKQ